MSIEESVCALVQQYWKELNPSAQAPNSLVFMKIAGKTSPNGVIIALILDKDLQRPVAVAKIPRNPLTCPGLDREYDAMLDVRKSFDNARILDRVPHHGVLADITGVKVLLQSACHGHPMVREMVSRESVEALYSEILPWMLEFHSAGAEHCVLEGTQLHNLIENPISLFMERYKDETNELLSQGSRQYLSELPQKVLGRNVRLCRQHGDFNAHNTLIERNGDQLSNFALIDWEDYQRKQLPIYDLNHFFISNSKVVGQGMSAGESFNKFVLNDNWYRDLYQAAISEYEARSIIDSTTFNLLTPLYLINECLRAAGAGREQEATAPVWINRLNLLVANN